MTAGSVVALFAVWAIAVASPGPDLVVVLQRSLAGRRHGLTTAVGVVAGITVWIVAAFAGLAAVLRVEPAVMTALQGAGGVLLATLGALGLRAWWRARNERAHTSPTAPSPAPEDVRGDVPPRGDLLRRDLLRGLATNLSNPKAVVFFGAVLAPFLTGELGVVQAVALVLGMVAVALAWFSGLAVAASMPGVHARIGRWLPWVDLVVSGLFVAVGLAFVIAALL